MRAYPPSRQLNSSVRILCSRLKRSAPERPRARSRPVQFPGIPPRFRTDHRVDLLDHPTLARIVREYTRGEYFGALLVQTVGRCIDARFQAPLDSTYPQLMLKTGTGCDGAERKAGNKKAVTLVMPRPPAQDVHASAALTYRDCQNIPTLHSRII